jgi:Calcineurin-like phosphoesterase
MLKYRFPNLDRLILVVAVVLTAALLATLFIGCGGSNQAKATTVASNTQPTAAAPAATPSNSPAPSTGSTTPTPTPAPTPTPTPTSSFRFLAWGDSRDYPSVLASLSNQAVALKPAFTVYTGDAESNGFTVSGADAFISAIDGYASNGTSAKTFLIRGNHDAGNTGGWQSYYNFAATATAVGATNFSALDADLTYSFDYQNAHFVAVDVPGDTDLITSAQMAWIDSDLTAAETRGVTHAFLYWHGPIYCVESQHCSFSGQLGSYAPQALVNVINKHAIISAMFFGHEHVLAHTHMDATRISGLTHPFEEIVVGTAGAPLYGCDMPARPNWCDAVAGYAMVDVAGPALTINYYKQGSTTPIKTVTYTK